MVFAAISPPIPIPTMNAVSRVTDRALVLSRPMVQLARRTLNVRLVFAPMEFVAIPHVRRRAWRVISRVRLVRVRMCQLGKTILMAFHRAIPCAMAAACVLEQRDPRAHRVSNARAVFVTIKFAQP